MAANFQLDAHQQERCSGPLKDMPAGVLLDWIPQSLEEGFVKVPFPTDPKLYAVDLFMFFAPCKVLFAKSL